MLLKPVPQGGTTKKFILDKSSFDLATLCITTSLRQYTSLSKKMKSRPVTTLFQIIRRP